MFKISSIPEQARIVKGLHLKEVYFYFYFFYFLYISHVVIRNFVIRNFELCCYVLDYLNTWFI